MKLLIVGSDKVFAIENFYAKYFKELGLDVLQFNGQSDFFDFYKKNIFNKILFKLGLSFIYKKINSKFKETINIFLPDIIFIFKGMEIYPSTLKWAKRKGIKLVNYNPDNPFIFSGKGSGNSNITKSIDLYDLHFTYNKEIEKQLQEKHKTKTSYLPFACDVSEDLFNICNEQQEILKTCFLGNPDKQRAKFINKLAEKGIEIDLYGNNWNRFVKHENITIYNPIYEIEQWKVLRKYRVQLNLMRIHNLNSHNMRTFKIPGIGGLQVAPYTQEHVEFFKEGEEIFLYKNLDECVIKINYLLKLNKDSTDALRKKSREAIVNGKHTYKDRSIFVYEEMKKLLIHA